jgi:FkbM family methyltransferase
LNAKADSIHWKIDELENTMQAMRTTANFNSAYMLYDRLKNEGHMENDNIQTFDAFLMLVMMFPEAAESYISFLKKRYIFFNDFLKKDQAGKEYIDIKGIRLTAGVPDDLTYKGFNNFEYIFQRTFFVYAFFNDNYDKSVVQILNRFMGEGPRSYKDGTFDVSVKPGDIVIDAGAWIGDFSAYAALKGAIVYAFEPARETYDLLCETAELNNGNIIPVDKALYSDSKKLYFRNLKYRAGNAVVKDMPGLDPKINIEEIDAITLDKFVEDNAIQKIDFVKSDIQGAERDMLKGAAKTLKTFAPRLAIATDHLPDDRAVIEKIILEANPKYKVVHMRTVLFAMVVEEKASPQ